MDPSKLQAGTFSSYAESMAAKIESELNYLRGLNSLDPLPANDVDRQMLFLAIARGVVKHLKEREKAFVVTSTVNITAFGSYTFTSTPVIGVQD
jgi:hypothetical protein